MNEFAVDVPVQINIWIRPECQKAQLEVLKQARPSTLIIISDGGRNDDEWRLIMENRKLIEDGINWNCTIYRLYEEENIGIVRIIEKMNEFVWSKVDRCIFLEDDTIPSVSFFRFCKELLDKYENDLRICAICGMNHLGVYSETDNDYFFSKQGSIWGYAFWKRTYETFSDYRYEDDPYTWKLLNEAASKDKMMLRGIKERRVNKNPDAKELYFSLTEYFMDLNMYSQNQLLIIPKKNMIYSMGASSEANGADTLDRLPPAIRKMYLMETYELEFPLRHPNFVIPDAEYEKKRNRIVGKNHPIISFKRKLERGLLVLKAGDFKYLWKKMRK